MQLLDTALLRHPPQHRVPPNNHERVAMALRRDARRRSLRCFVLGLLSIAGSFGAWLRRVSMREIFREGQAWK